VLGYGTIGGSNKYLIWENLDYFPTKVIRVRRKITDKYAAKKSK